MKHITSKSKRNDPLFLRNAYTSCGKWGIPMIRKQNINLDHLRLIAYSSIRINDTPENRNSGVHFFMDDFRFNTLYTYPKKHLERLLQYAFLLTPDYSAYADMPPWRQLESICHSRWCGAFWQSQGATVIPTLTWSTPSSFEYCFDGVEKNSIIAIGTIGCKRNRFRFMQGYNEMLERLSPSAIICYGSPFPEMEGPIIPIPYEKDLWEVQ